MGRRGDEGMRGQRFVDSDETLQRARMVTVRMPPKLHKHLKEVAEAGGVSLNRLCLALLSGQPISGAELPEPDLNEEVQRA